MNKTILFAFLVLGGVVSAQTNAQLKQRLEKERVANKAQFSLYLGKQKELQAQQKDKNGRKISEKLREGLNQKGKKISFFFDGKPYYLKPLDLDQIQAANADALQNGGAIKGLSKTYNGEGIKVSVFDGGRVYAQHRDFGNASRISNKEADAVEYSAHATGVTGMLGAIGHEVGNASISGNTKGVMPRATFDSYSFQETTLIGETSEKNVFQKILNAKPSLSNHSYGVNTQWEYDDAIGAGWYYAGFYDPDTKRSYDLDGCYYDGDRNYDDIVYANPEMIIVKAAGNSFGDGPGNFPLDNSYYEAEDGTYTQFTSSDTLPEDNCSQGYDCIGPGSLAKNIIVVGATEKLSTSDNHYHQTSDVEKASYSSAGPRDDGAIKPDIAGVGSDVFYASTNERGSEEWGMGDGTSYATPLVTGVIGLWSQVYKDLFSGKNLNAASAKALLIHSAQEAGNKGPDVWYGWGFADAKKGAELLVDKFNNNIVFEDKRLNNKGEDTTDLIIDSTQPLKITLVWTDPSYKNMPTTWDNAHNNRVSRLVNDLDLRLINTDTNETFYPWKLDITAPLAPALKGDNTVDNVEQILIDAPKSGNYRVVVTHKGNLVNNTGDTATGQDYSIIMSGGISLLTLDESIDKDEVLVVPSIVVDTFKIHNHSKIKSLSLYDASGRLLKTMSKDFGQPIDISALSPGIYVIQLITANDNRITKKIIKQ